MTLPANVSLDDILEACEMDRNTGFCLACGEEQDGCEPDMRSGICESCGEPRVFGAEEILLHCLN